MGMTLRPETEKRIRDRMQAGGYASPDEVVQEGLRLLDDRDRMKRADLDEVRRRIATGLEQLDRGEGIDGEKVFEELLTDLERDGEAA